MFSRRLPSDVSTNRLTERLRSLRARNIKLLDLTQSNPSLVGLDYPLGSSEEFEAILRRPYSPHPFGLSTARHAVARNFTRRNILSDLHRIILTSSTSESYSFLFKLICNPGESVLIPRPGYPLLEHLTKLDAVKGIPYPLYYHGEWSIDLESLAKSVTKDTRAVVIVSPNNPTGSFVKLHELEVITSLCRRYNLVLIGDEIFADYPFPYNGKRGPSVLEQKEVLAFSLGGLSKSVGLPGAKLSWMAVGGPEIAVEEALARLELICDTYLSVSDAIQDAVPGLLALGDATRQKIASRVAENHTTLSVKMRTCPACQVLETEGGWMAIIQVPSTETEEILAIELLEFDHVLVYPGYFFDFTRECFVVVSLLTNPEDFTEGITRLLKRVMSV